MLKLMVHTSPLTRQGNRDNPGDSQTSRPSDHELEVRGHQQALLIEVDAMLAEAPDAEAALGQILSRLRERCQFTRASIYEIHPEKPLLRCIAESGHPSVDVNRIWALDAPGLVPWVARSAEALYVPDVAREPRSLCEDPRTRSQYTVPLRRGSIILGVLDIQSDQLDGVRAVTRKLVDQIAARLTQVIERGGLLNKLRACEERFRSIFEQSYLGVALCNLDGVFSAVNPAFAHLLGYEPEELRGKHYGEVTHPEDRQQSLEQLKSLSEGNQEHAQLEKRYVHKSGKTVWGSTVVSTVRGPAGHPAHFLLMIEDISKAMKSEQERDRLQEQLTQAQKMEAIGTLAGGLAHDFNNFLGVILGFASLVRVRLRPGDPLLEPVRMIEQSAESAADLTRQLLGLARQEKQERVRVDVGEILKHVVKIITRTFDRRIQMETRLAPELPAVEVEAGQLEHAILNLCINARDAMPEGGKLTLETSLMSLRPGEPLLPPQCSPGNYVRIAVKDTGLGIEPQAMSHLFEPFFTTKESGRGTGLGLAMVYRIVHDHGGFVRAESEVVRGSQFSLYLPALEPRPVPSKRHEPVEVQYGSGTVLVVDDEPMVLAFAERGLEKLGYNVLTAESGRRACEIYASREREIDCVLLDMVMPEISGLETFQKIREINPQARVILSSGYSMERIAREARKMGAADFIGKPYTLEALSLALKKVHQA